MAFSLTDIAKQIQKLETLLAQDFQLLSAAIRNGDGVLPDQKMKLRLVEQLQYHDILRQKLEHVRHFHEMLASDQEEGSLGSVAIKNIQPEWLELSLGLLRFTRLEYQEVVKETRQLLFPTDLGNDLSPSKTSLFEQDIQKLIKNLEKLYIEMESADDGQVAQMDSERFRKIFNSFSMKSEREVFSMLFDMEEPVGTEEKNDQEGDVELF